MDEKLELIEEHQEGYSLNACLQAVGVSKGALHYRMRGGSKEPERVLSVQVVGAACC